MATVEEFPIELATAKEEIANLVKTVPLTELTSKKIRSHLEEKFSKNFGDHKATINELTKEAIEKMEENKDSDSSSDEEGEDNDQNKPDKSIEASSSAKKDSSSSDSDSDHGLASTQRASTKSRKRKVSTTEDDLSSRVKSGRRAAATKASQSIRKSAGYSRSKSDKSKNSDNSAKFGRMTKLCWISPDLQEVLNAKYMKRCDVVKEMWAYVRRKELLDPKDKRFAICDEALTKVFKKKRFRLFGMAKELGKHVKCAHELGEEIEAEANAEMERLRAIWQAKQSERKEGDEEQDEEEKPRTKSKKTAEFVADDDSDSD